MSVAICITLLMFAIGTAQSQSKQRQLMKKIPPEVAKFRTKTAVKLQIGPDKDAWGNAWKGNAPSLLNVRWSAGILVWDSGDTILNYQH